MLVKSKAPNNFIYSGVRGQATRARNMLAAGATTSDSLLMSMRQSVRLCGRIQPLARMAARGLPQDLFAGMPESADAFNLLLTQRTSRECPRRHI